MESLLSFRVWVSWKLDFYNFHLIALSLTILIANAQCLESLRDHRLHGPDLRPRPQSDTQVLALGNHGAAAAEERHLATRRRDLKSTSRTKNVRSKELRANINGTSAPEAEVKALAAFRSAISRDPLDALRSWGVRSATNVSDVCSGWAGVTCSPQYPYHVVSLSLPDLQLAGNLNSAMREFAQLPFLQRLDLSDNSFTGFIKGEALTNFSHLSYLNVSFNFLTGTIPPEIGELVSLQDLDLSTNNLSGLIPSLANCSFLRLIKLNTNFLDGNIPPWLGRLSSLSRLQLRINSLYGQIPSELGNCSSLRTLDVASNAFLGPVLPQELSQLQLQILEAQYCSFRESLPPWIGNMTNMTILSLAYNLFEGEIPESVGQLQLLNGLYLGGNLLTGVVPVFLSNCTFLETLALESNQFRGHIPHELGILANLELLSLWGNNLTGVVPSSLDNCSALVELALGLNRLMDPQPFPLWIGSHITLQYTYFPAMNLQGELPQSIGNLSNLQELHLSGNNLSGTIPPSLKNCVFLTILELPDNSLTGNIPSDLGLLSYLTDLALYDNYFTGPFPAVFVNWTQLVSFDVADNLLSGMLAVPATLGNLKQLNYFDASDNKIAGPIPETLGNFSSTLTVLALNGNYLSGEVPGFLGNITSLQLLNLQDNLFQGKLPAVDLSRFGRQFFHLDLSLNLLEGSIPSEIGGLSGLKYLNLSRNNFNGSIPNSLGNCSNMNLLDLSHNNFVGDIPASAITAMFASLGSLSLSHNFLSGSWPREFSKLTSVQDINVAANNLSGSIPVGLGGCFSLQSLDISINGFTGEIPQDLGSLPELQFFNASFNDFEGPIPQMGLFDSNRINGESFLGNPALCGPADIIGANHLKCPVLPGNVSSHKSCRGFKCTKVWVPVTAAGVTSIALLVVFIVTGTNLRWGRSRGPRNADDDKQVILNFVTHVRFTESDVLRTINDPSKDNVIGRGARSIVYKGVQPGVGEFALKKLVPAVDPAFKDSGVGVGDKADSEPAKEAEALANLRHRNILKCLAFYSKADLTALLLEYMCNGSLHGHLHQGGECKLTWETRLKIAMGVAQGLLYLHHDCPEPIIHRDLKPCNILLDADFEPKIGDFGISKYVNPLRDGEVTGSTICGTIGYMPPEYASTPLVSIKGDVYSYGVVLLELLTRTQPTSMSDLGNDGLDLRSRVLQDFDEKPFELLDPDLFEECRLDDKAMEQIMLLLRVGLFCTRVVPGSRPSMISVVGFLEFILNFGVAPASQRTILDLANGTDQDIVPSEDPAGEGAEFGMSG